MPTNQIDISDWTSLLQEYSFQVSYYWKMEALKTIIEHRKDDVKELSRMAVNTAKTFEQASRNAANSPTQQYW
jgi:hypothetical protein